MNPMTRNGLLVAALHVALVGSLGAKLLVDRAVRPRAWSRAGPVDPNLPIRGRYVSLRLEAAIDEGTTVPVSGPVVLSVKDQQLIAGPASGSNSVPAFVTERDGRRVVVLRDPAAYFIPEHVADPSRRPAGEELWVEVTLPRSGAPRPIRLGVKKDGVLTPLELK